MDWSVAIYFLAAVIAAGVSYAVWPKHLRPPLNFPDAFLSGLRILTKTPSSGLAQKSIEQPESNGQSVLY